MHGFESPLDAPQNNIRLVQSRELLITWRALSELSKSIHKLERERTNEQARHPKPKPYSTKATQAKTQESHGEAAGNGAGDKRERERTRTDKHEQEATKPSRENSTKKQGPPQTE